MADEAKGWSPGLVFQHPEQERAAIARDRVTDLIGAIRVADGSDELREALRLARRLVHVLEDLEEGT